ATWWWAVLSATWWWAVLSATWWWALLSATWWWAVLSAARRWALLSTARWWAVLAGRRSRRLLATGRLLAAGSSGIRRVVALALGAVRAVTAGRRRILGHLCVPFAVRVQGSCGARGR
ncbi:MAG TPA: hypothetical protein VIW24_30545, partial [Aldersonia sp.]